MKTRYALFLLPLFLLNACHNDRDEIIYVDDYAPLPPVGITSISLDDAVELQWIDNQEMDLAAYNIYVSDRYNGTYSIIGTSQAADFIDRGAVNGVTNYYAVTAFDYNGNESELSRDVAYDTPRPEGRGVTLYDRFLNPVRAGYDFSAYDILHFDTDFTDVFFETNDDGIPYLVVWDDTEIQDMGFTTSIDEISSAPAAGWNPTGDALAIRGHTYVIQTFDHHYAKIRIIDIPGTKIIFDWAYQVAKGNPELLVGREKTLSKRSRKGLRRH